MMYLTASARLDYINLIIFIVDFKFSFSMNLLTFFIFGFWFKDSQAADFFLIAAQR